MENMPIYEYNRRKEDLLTAFNSLAPNGQVQRAMVEIVHSMEKDGSDYAAVLTTIVNAMCDGVNYGNWPQPNSSR